MDQGMDEIIVNALGPYTRAIFRPEIKNGVAFFASGVLLLIESRFFLITAAHVLDHLSEINPLFMEWNGNLVPIEGSVISSSTEGIKNRSGDKIDIAIVEFLKLKESHLEGVAYISLENLDLHGETNPNLGYAFVGYPESKNRMAINKYSKSIHPVMYGAMCWEAENHNYYRVGASFENNILLKFNKKRVYGLEGNPRTAPNLNALSGSPIWGRNSEGTPFVVGILIEHHSSDIKCVVGTRIFPILKLLKVLLGAGGI